MNDKKYSLTKRNLRFGLRLKLLAVVLVGMILGFTFLGIHGLSESKKSIEDEINTSGNEQNQIVAESLSNLLIAYDYTNIESFTERIVQLRDVKKIRITNKSGKVMATRSYPKVNLEEILRHYEKPITFHGKIIGKVEIWISPERLYQKLKSDNIQMVIMLCLFALLLGALLYITISLVILKPIANFRDLLIAIVENPSDHKLAQPEVATGDEIGELALIFNKMYQNVFEYQKILKEKNVSTALELEEANLLLLNTSKMAALGEMAGGIAHEINNPLAIITGRSDKVLRMISDPTADKSSIYPEIVKIKLTATRIAKIVKGMRTFSRRGEKDLFTKTKLTEIIDVVIDLCNDKLLANQVSLFVEEIPEIEIECRESQIVQVILNLIVNSIDAIGSFDEKWIRLEAIEATKGWIEISITDAGQGISPELAQKIMLPFFTTKEKNKGTGLGLSISHSIALDHEGNLTIDSSSSNTRFVLRLPAVQNQKLQK